MITLFGKTLCESCFSENSEDPCAKCGFSASKYQPNPSALPVEHKLQERYLIGGVIGKGGFGITYAAFDTKLERRVAIKEYFPNGLAVRTPGTTTVSAANTDSPEVFDKGAEKFYNEARLVARFSDNQNIVSIYDFFYENSTVYYVMEYLHGQSMKKYIAKHGTVSPEQAVYIAKEVANALVSSHSANVLHRDISPGNIMLCNNGKVKLIDFGSARQVVSEGSKSMSVILTPGFAPLEQYQKKGKQGPWTDIYALGATLYYLATGNELDDPISRMEDDEAFSSNVHGINDELWAVIKKSTMLKPEDRYKDIFQFRDALNKIPLGPAPLIITQDDSINIINYAADSLSESANMSSEEVDSDGTDTSVKEDNSSSADNLSEDRKSVKESDDSAISKDTDKKPAGPADDAAKIKNKRKKKRLMLAAGIVVTVAIVIVVAAVILVPVINERRSYSTTHINLGGSWVPWDGKNISASGINVASFSSAAEKAKDSSDVVIDISSCTLSAPSVLSELENIDNLHELKLSDCNLSDISALENVTKLTYLDLSLNSISDISSLKRMTKLTSLSLSYNDISDISALKNMTKLTKLNLHYNDITDISALKRMTKLTRLVLSYNDISDISVLENMTELTELYLYGNKITDISVLKKLPNLKTLSITYYGRDYMLNTPEEIAQFLERNVKEVP